MKLEVKNVSKRFRDVEVLKVVKFMDLLEEMVVVKVFY